MSDLTLGGVATLTIAMMTTSVFVATSLAIIAAFVQRLAGRAMPARFIWAVALATTCLVTLLLPVRMSQAPEPFVPPTSFTEVRVGEEGWVAISALERVGFLAQAALTPAEGIIRSMATWSADQIATAPRAVQWVVVLGWPAATVALLALFALSYRRQLRVLSQATQATLQQVSVYVAAVNGPVVLGLRTPRIMVPAWLLSREPEEQRLVVQHEQAHIAAHDPHLLLTACIAAMLLPWNAAAWFMLARLRLAIELDCDARVLSHGTSTRRYGELLIALSAEPARIGAAPRMPMSATAFSYRTSHLERRLRTMTAPNSRFLMLRRMAVALFGSVGLLAACRAELPTSAELQAMDVASAERRVGRVVSLGDTNTVYFVNGTQVERAVATSLSADRIASIDVRKVDGGVHQVFVVTGRPISASSDTLRLQADTLVFTRARGDSLPVILRERDANREVVRGVAITGIREGIGERMVVGSPNPKTFDGLIFIDGLHSTSDALSKLSPNAIVSIEIVKGEAAVKRYGQLATKGVILVQTKK